MLPKDRDGRNPSDIASWARWPSEADFIPSRWMSIVGADDVVQHSLGEEAFGRQVTPQPFAHVTLLHGRKQSVLIERAEFVKATGVTRVGLGVERRKTARQASRMGGSSA